MFGDENMDNLSTRTVNVKILFFAKSRELSGQSETTIEVPSTIKCLTLLNRLCDYYNLNCIKNNLILALNSDYCDDIEVDLNLAEGDEIAIIPPISGG